ncbi:MAG: dihydrodipicolinate synthase family protein [Chlamydiota bacterium]
MNVVYSIEDGVYAAALTPLHSDLNCDYEELTKHCLDLMDRGCKGVVLFGTTGEGPSFSSLEKEETIRQVILRGLDPGKIIVGTGSSNLQDTVALVSSVLEYNCLACLISPPCFFKNITEEGVIAFYREVIKRVANPKLQVILYHIPQYTGVPLTVYIVEKLCEEFPEVIVGLKESEGDLSLMKGVLKAVPRCKVFVGKENLIPEAISLGASGAICGMANLWPEIICSLYEKGEDLDSEKMFLSIGNRPFIASCKALLAEKRGLNWRLVRPPLVPLSAVEIR